MTSSLTFTFPYDYANSEDQIFPWSVTFTYLPPLPGFISGPPESCYPEEPEEVEIIEIISERTGKEIDHTTLPEELLDELEGEALAYIESRKDEIPY